MAPPSLFLFIFIFLFNPHKINSSTCTLDFSQFPYVAHGECFDIAMGSAPALTTQSCCRSALQSLFQAMVIRANRSRSIFLDLTQAQDCSTTFQSFHNRTNLSKCEFQNFISSSTANPCSKDVDSVISYLGIERYNAFQSNCRDLSVGNYSDDACCNCQMSYRQSLQALKESDRSNGKMCAEALLVSLASSDVDSPNWVHGTFSCLWDEIQFQFPTQKHRKGYFLGSKKLLAILIVAATLVILAPILYKLTRKRLQDASEKEVESLSMIVLEKILEVDVSRNAFNCSDLYIFSQDEMMKATNNFNNSNLIGDGTLGKIYIGIMPSGMRAAIKRINEGVQLHDFIDEICRKAKIRHPNLVSVLGYCDRGHQCLVYEYCVNGDLASWLLGDRRRPMIITWDQRLQISVAIARGLWFLHHNPLEKMVHGDIKLTNILLNEKLEAKLSDSVLSKCKSKETNGMETMANDVFNFGVVLLQLLTGRKPKSLVNEARGAVLKGGSMSAMADPRLNGAYVPAEFRNILSIAVLCTAPNERERPKMEEVLRKLEETQILV